MGHESKSFVVMGFYDCHNKLYAFIHISVKGTTWKQDIYIYIYIYIYICVCVYRQRPSYHKFYCSVKCMECKEELHGQISKSLIGSKKVREARKI